MNTLTFLKDYFSISPSDTSYPLLIPKSRWDIGSLIHDLGFKKGVEVGVYRGAFTSSLARKAPQTQIYGIDAWKVYPGYKDTGENDLESVAEAEAIKRASDFKNIILIKGWSLDIAKQFTDNSLDFVYIDANHDYEHCKADLAAWYPKVKPEGLIIGHDYVHKKDVGVIQAVDEFVKINNITPLFIWTDRTPSWMFIKP